ncbi:MAG: hypothetical protein LBQ92_02385 [Propionibacteriaceae bacterium]|jgi:hypothetical protein|nr:hypothetical protein [Propionibacteriaceae bacterium]
MPNEPRRPFTALFALGCFFAADAALFAALIWGYWLTAAAFPQGTTLFSWFPQADMLSQVLLVCALTVGAVIIGAFLGIAGWYGYLGYKWTRIWGIFAFLLACAAPLIGWLGWAVAGLAFAGLFALWLPATGRFFRACHARRHPAPTFEAMPENVAYGPLPKYR